MCWLWGEELVRDLVCINFGLMIGLVFKVIMIGVMSIDESMWDDLCNEIEGNGVVYNVIWWLGKVLSFFVLMFVLWWGVWWRCSVNIIVFLIDV